VLVDRKVGRKSLLHIAFTLGRNTLIMKMQLAKMQQAIEAL